jgi:restriction system protein
MKPDPDTNDVFSALSLLRDSLSEEEQRIRSEGAQAMKDGEYDTATAVIDFAKRLLSFRDKVEGLVAEWDELADLRDKASPAVQEIVSKRFFGRRKSGEITSHTDFCPYILKVLMQMGGSGKTQTVIDAVGEEMKGVLKPKDFEIHKSSGKQLRWRNTCQWARNLMVNSDGRMRSDSPRGIWEISDKGKAWLKNHK